MKGLEKEIEQLKEKVKLLERIKELEEMIAKLKEPIYVPLSKSRQFG